MARRNRKEDLDEITRALGQNDSEYSAPLGSDGPVSLLALLLGALVLALVLAGYLVFSIDLAGQKQVSKQLRLSRHGRADGGKAEACLATFVRPVDDRN